MGCLNIVLGLFVGALFSKSLVSVYFRPKSVKFPGLDEISFTWYFIKACSLNRSSQGQDSF